MTQRRSSLRLLMTVFLSSALLLAGCGQGADDSGALSRDTLVKSIQEGTADSTGTVVPDDGIESSDSETSGSVDEPSSSETDVITNGELDLSKVEAELEAIERELDTFVFPDDSMFDDAAGALF